MATKVKGLLKGLRYISQIFDEKDQEIQIGFPTDVKHVAHIGWDGPSQTASTPSWMTEFKSSQEASAGQLAVKELSAQDINKNGLAIAKGLVHMHDVPKTTSSPSKKSSDASTKKHSRRHRSCEGGGVDSPARESSIRSSRKIRNSSNVSSEGTSQEPPGVPKTRRKKGSTDGSTRSRRPRSKGQTSLTDISLEGSENGSLHGSLHGSSPMHPGFAEENGPGRITGGISIK